MRNLDLENAVSASYDSLEYARGRKLTAVRSLEQYRGKLDRIPQWVKPLLEIGERVVNIFTDYDLNTPPKYRDWIVATQTSVGITEDRLRELLPMLKGQFVLDQVIYHPQTTYPGSIYSVRYRVPVRDEVFRVVQHFPEVDGQLVEGQKRTITLFEALPAHVDDPDSGFQRNPLIKAPAEFLFDICKLRFCSPSIYSPTTPWTPTLTVRPRRIVPPLLES